MFASRSAIAVAVAGFWCSIAMLKRRVSRTGVTVVIPISQSISRFNSSLDPAPAPLGRPRERKGSLPAGICSSPRPSSFRTTSPSSVRFVTSSAAVNTVTLSDCHWSLAIASPVRGERFGSLRTSTHTVAT